MNALALRVVAAGDPGTAEAAHRRLLQVRLEVLLGDLLGRHGMAEVVAACAAAQRRLIVTQSHLTDGWIA